MRKIYEIMHIFMQYNFAGDVFAGSSGDLFISGPAPSELKSEELAKVKTLGASYFEDDSGAVWLVKY